MGKRFFLHGFWDFILRSSYRTVHTNVKGYALFRVASGSGCLRVGEVQRSLKSGMIVAVSAGSVAEIVPEPGDALHIAEILLDFQEGLDTLQDHAAIRESLAAHLLTPLPASTEMYSAWNALRSELNSMEVFQESVLELLLRQILIYLYRTCLAEEKPAAVSGKAAQERVNEVDTVYRPQYTVSKKRISCERSPWLQLLLFISCFFCCNRAFFTRLFFAEKVRKGDRTSAGQFEHC